MKLEDTQISKEDWAGMTLDEQWQYIRILEKSDYELRQLLKINECPRHGVCIPHTRQILMRASNKPETIEGDLREWS